MSSCCILLPHNRRVLRLVLLGRRMTCVYGLAQLDDALMLANTNRTSSNLRQHRQQRSSPFYSTKTTFGKVFDITAKKNSNNSPPTTRGTGSGKNQVLGKDTVHKDQPRRIVVNKDGGGNSKTKKSSRPKNIGKFKRRFRLENEIPDSNGKTIWIPSRSNVTTTTTGGSKDGNNKLLVTQHRQLPQIRAQAWLDPSVYCRGGGSTIAGTDAARRLLRGKRDFMELLRYAVHDHKFPGSSGKDHRQQQQQHFVLQGHGVPHQVLQYHIDCAAELMLQLRASEISFKQFNVSQHHNSVAALEAVRDLDVAYVRDYSTGENMAIRWPPPPFEDTTNNNGNDTTDQHHRHLWIDDLQLYWTVMNRIATRLGVAVLLKRPRRGSSLTSPNERGGGGGEYTAAAPSLLKTPPHHWKVHFARGWYFAKEELPHITARQATRQLYPVLEWTPLEGVSAPGHVCIRLQGYYDHRHHDGGTPSDHYDEQTEPMQVSLCFDACFRNSMTTV